MPSKSIKTWKNPIIGRPSMLRAYGFPLSILTKRKNVDKNAFMPSHVTVKLGRKYSGRDNNLVYISSVRAY